MASFSDNFDRADNADLGANWDVHGTSAAAQIVSNMVRPTTFAVTSRENHNGFTVTDSYAQLTLVTFDHVDALVFAGLLLRADSADVTTYQSHAIKNLSNVTAIEKNVSGVVTSLATDTTGNWTDGDVIQFRVVADQLTTYRNGVEVLTITDSAIAGPGRIGIMCSTSNTGTVANCEIDDFIGGDYPVIVYRLRPQIWM